MSEARNRGMELAGGAYLVFLDGEDLLHPFFLEKSLKRAKRTGADVVGCQYFRVPTAEVQHDIRQNFPATRNMHWTSPTPEQLHDWFFNRHDSTLDMVTCKLLRRSALCEDGVMQKFKRGLALGEDTVFMYDLVQKGVRMEFTNARWYLYRTHGQSATHRQKEYREEKLLAFYKTMQKAAAQAGNTEYAQKMEWARLSALRKKYNVARWRGQADVCLRVRREVLCIMRRRKTDLSKLVYYLTFHSMILYGIGSTMSHLVRRMKGEKI